MPKKLEVKTIFKGVDRMTRVTSRIQRKLGAFTRSTMRGLKRVQKVTRAVGRALRKGLKRGIQGATVALAAFGAIATKVISIGAEFEKTLVIAASKFPGKIRKGSEEFQKLEEAARRLAKTNHHEGDFVVIS